MQFRNLFDMEMNPKWDVIESITEFRRLKDTKQNTVWHHENAFEHTKNVTMQMKKYLDDNNIDKNSSYYLVMMCAALCHDLGKADATSWNEEKQNWQCRKHGEIGERLTRKLFYDNPFLIRETICYMVRWHMVLHHIFDDEYELEICIKMDFLSKGLVSVKNMLILNKCDSLGSVNDIETEEMLNERWNRIEKIAKDMDCYDTVFTDFQESFLDSRMRVYMLIGLPGSGKNWLIENDDYLKSLPSLSRDDIRTEIGIKGIKPQGNKEEEKKVTEIFNERMIRYCKENRSFIINNTNLKSVYRKQYADMLKNYNVKLIYLYVEPDSIEMNYDRRRFQMPLDVIDRMMANIDFPHPTEWSDAYFYINGKFINNDSFKNLMQHE